MNLELLSPAGNFEKLRTAFDYGADAVYTGLPGLSLRSRAGNFKVEELANATEYAHSLGKKVYLAINIFFHQQNFDHFTHMMKEIKDIPIDAYIMSDLGAIYWMKNHFPERQIHISTQANTTHSETVRFYHSLGINRVILARELPIGEIKRIRDDNPDMELEVFVHGSMCIAYSGRCLLSNYFTNPNLKTNPRAHSVTRDANLGDCAQSCRWNYVLMEETRPGEAIPIEENPNGTAILSSKDLNVAARISELIDAGVNSFKIEGRMKSVYYVANTTRVYRHAIDSALAGNPADPQKLDHLNQISHRIYTTGFFFGDKDDPTALHATPDSRYQRDYRYMGKVVQDLGNHHYQCRSVNVIDQGMKLETISPKWQDAEITDYSLIQEGETRERILPNTDFVLECPNHLSAGDILRIQATF